MLISGLWKLAAMAGVIGVGLVAVYQAKQGLEQLPVAAINQEEVGDEVAAVEEGASVTSAEPTSDSVAENTLQVEDPFAEQTPRTATVRAKEIPVEEESVTESGPSIKPPATEEVTASASPPAGPGLDFRDDLSSSGPDLSSGTSKSKIQQIGFDDAPPARLPEDADPFLESNNPPKPFVRQTNETQADPKTNGPAEEADPFLESAPPELSGNAPVEKAKPIEMEADPFGETPAPNDVRTPSKPEVDPFDSVPETGGSSTEPVPSLAQPKSPQRPGRTESRDEVPAESSDPFGDPSTAPPELTPRGPRGGTKPIEPQEAPTETVAPRERPSLPRLPTEVTDPSVPGEVAEPSPRSRSPRRNDPPSEEPQNPTPEDLAGDGVIGTTTARGVQQPRLTIEKIAPEKAVLGEPLVYSVIVKNVGGIEAHQVVVEDRIPKGTELTGTAPRAELIDKKLVWRIGTMQPNEEKKISIRVIPRQEGAIGSVARVNFTAEVAAEIMIAAPQLSFKVNAPREVRIGDSIDLTFLLKNSGGAAANNVSIRDLIPEGLKHEAAADIECPIGKLGPNESREIVLHVTAVKPGKVKNRAILTADGGISQELESVIDIVGEHLVLTRTGQNRVYAERPAVYTNSVKNEGNAEVRRVKVSEIIPIGMEFVEASEGGRFDPVERAIHWTVGPLAPGDEASVTAKLIAKTPGSQTATISATGSAGSAASIKSEVDVVGRPELQMESLNAAGQVAVGDRLTSKIQLKNSGSAPARNVSLSISIPPEMKLIEIRGGRHQQQNNLIRFEALAELAPRDAVAYEIVMEAVAEADAKIDLQISADHLTKPARRTETVQIAAEIK